MVICMNKEERDAWIKRVYDRVKHNGEFIRTDGEWHYYYEKKSLTLYKLTDDGRIEEADRTEMV